MEMLIQFVGPDWVQAAGKGAGVGVPVTPRYGAMVGVWELRGGGEIVLEQTPVLFTWLLLQ